MDKCPQPLPLLLLFVVVLVQYLLVQTQQTNVACLQRLDESQMYILSLA